MGVFEIHLNVVVRVYNERFLRNLQRDICYRTFQIRAGILPLVPGDRNDLHLCIYPDLDPQTLVCNPPNPRVEGHEGTHHSSEWVFGSLQFVRYQDDVDEGAPFHNWDQTAASCTPVALLTVAELSVR